MFFRCISYVITGNENYYSQVRGVICNHMMKFSSSLEVCIFDGEDIKEHISHMRKDRSWATQVEMWATAHFLKTDIYCHAYNSWPLYSGKYIDRNISLNSKSIYLKNINNVHFEVVLSVENIYKPVSEILLKNMPSTQEKLIKKRDYMRNKRKDPLYLEKEKQQKQEKRKCPQQLEKEKLIKRQKRKDPSQLEKEKLHKKEIRKDPNQLEKEKLHKQEIRKDPSQLEREKFMMKKKRNDPKQLEKEKFVKQEKRKDPEYLAKEKNFKKSKREDPLYKLAERSADQLRKMSNFASAKHLDALINIFKESVSQGTDYICICCEQVWFADSVVPSSSVINPSTSIIDNCMKETSSFDGKSYLCRTCFNAVRNNKIPSLAICNKLDFPFKPPFLSLNSLEEKLVAPVITFYQMRELPAGGQKSIQGNIVSVPADNISTISSLPRPLESSLTIPVKLKRRMRYKSHFIFENIRPKVCYEAAAFLLNKPLFKSFVSEGLDENWLNVHVPLLKGTNWEYFIKNYYTNPKNKIDSSFNEIENSENDWSETEDEDLIINGLEDSMLYPENIEDQGKILSFAPCEGNIPISSLEFCIEELSFPSIFCGEKRPSNEDRISPLKYSEICKSELRRYDRRCAVNVPNIFFKVKKLQMKQIQDRVWVSLNRFKCKDFNLTAGDLKSHEKLDKLINLNEGYKIFRTLRGSPPYWENVKKNLFAMIRQLGLPTFFLTLSAAEMRWIPLLKTLGKLIDKKNYSDDEITSLSWQKKSYLIRSDPVTVARYFDYRVHKFFQFLSSPLSPLGKLTEYFYRVEFQQRGSPHIHAMLWIEDAPQIEQDSDDDVIKFIDNCISVDNNNSDNYHLIKLQMHKHSSTCKKKSKKKVGNCRFNFPKFPIKQTCILKAFKNDINSHSLKKYKYNYERILNYFNESKTYPSSIDAFLKELNLKYDDYILAIRSSIQKKEIEIFFKREPNEVRINNYNISILKAWEANIDLQYITNAYACVMYIVSYISKGTRGMSNLLRRASEELKFKESSIQEQVRTIGNKFLRHVEISAQEAVYLVLQLRLNNSNCGHVFINTSPSEERLFILKSAEELDALPDNSTDIKASNIFHKYSKRPVSLENLCLAMFVAWYEIKYSKNFKISKMKQYVPENELEENIDDLNEDSIFDEDGHSLEFFKSYILKKRKKKKIIRFVGYSKILDSENFHREQILLFYPWRNEEILKNPFSTYEEKYKSVLDVITENKVSFEPKSNVIEALEEMNEDRSDTSDEENNIKPTSIGSGINREDIFTEYDIGKDLNLHGSDIKEEHIKNRMNDFDFRLTTQILNVKQKEIFYHVIKHLKTNEDQLLLFISGGAGVGKTKLLECIYQTMIRHYNTKEGTDPDQMSVLLTAPTGKAAYLIKGRTIHNAFNIPASQGFHYRPLNRNSINSLRRDFDNLKLIIIDEISMVGSNMFSFINQRLQEITCIKQPFGGLNMLLFGDLFQLHPVMDKWIFQNPNTSSFEGLCENTWKKFKFYELDEIMRQKDDFIFAEILNRIREGTHTKSDISLLSKRGIKRNQPNYPLDKTHLLHYNKKVDAFNSDMYLKCDKRKMISVCTDIVIGDVSIEVKKKVLSNTKFLEMNLCKQLEFGVGLRYELSINVDVSDGLVNGAGGIIVDLEFQKNKLIYVWIKFDEENVGLKLRNEYLKNNLSNQGCTPIRKVSRDFTAGRYKNLKVLRTQFPIRPASAKTIYRSQGDTLNYVVVELPDRKLSHLHYVAFSRVIKLENLFILNSENIAKISVDSFVKEEMKILRTDQKVELCYTPLYKISHLFRVFFHNVQSLRLHINDVKCDFNFQASDICMLVESNLCSKDIDNDFFIPNFILFRNDFQMLRSTYGTAIYYKNNLNLKLTAMNFKNIEITKIEYFQILIFCVYSRPKESISNLCEAMKIIIDKYSLNRMCLIMGDFNCNKQKNNSKYKHLENFMMLKGFYQLITEFTTNYNTTIDLIFTNRVNEVFHGVLESYFSYHKPIWVGFAK